MPLVVDRPVRERPATAPRGFVAAPLRDTKTPPLEQGDHLTREEFELRFHAMPNLKKAELIEGIVHMPSPVRWNQHARPQSSGSAGKRWLPFASLL